MRFDTTEQLDRWLKSPERAALVKEAESLVDYAHLQQNGNFLSRMVPDGSQKPVKARQIGRPRCSYY